MPSKLEKVFRFDFQIAIYQGSGQLLGKCINNQDPILGESLQNILSPRENLGGSGTPIKNRIIQGGVVGGIVHAMIAEQCQNGRCLPPKLAK